MTDFFVFICYSTWPESECVWYQGCSIENALSSFLSVYGSPSSDEYIIIRTKKE